MAGVYQHFFIHMVLNSDDCFAIVYNFILELWAFKNGKVTRTARQSIKAIFMVFHNSESVIKEVQ
ncbi:MAG: hypothetical protein ACRCVY_01860 [Commensalibacter sp.]|nr:hypothetical protein [Commensalibacter sp.]